MAVHGGVGVGGQGGEQPVCVRRGGIGRRGSACGQRCHVHQRQVAGIDSLCRRGLLDVVAFISTTAVYQAWNTVSLDESAPTWPGTPEQDGDPADLGKMPVHKRGCELAVEQTYGRTAV